jgi:hypothetical protein
MQPKGILSEIPDEQDLPSEIKAAINENTGILFDVDSSISDKNAARQSNIAIFKKYGNIARDHYDSIKSSALQGADEAVMEKELTSKTGKATMMYGGMANKKKHMYTAGGNVTDNLKPIPPSNKGLMKLSKSKKGADAVVKMGFKPKTSGSA